MLRVKTKHLAILLSILFGTSTFSQKKVISPNSWDEWRTMSSIQQSHSGDWISYELNPLEGDKSLVIRSTSNETEKIILRGEKAGIHHKDQYVAFVIVPGFDTIRKLKLEKVKKSNYPNDSLGIYWLNKDSLALVPDIQSFKMSEKGDWLAYLSTKDLRPKPKKKKFRLFKRKKKFKQIESTGTTLTLYNPVSGEEKNIHRVTDYKFDKHGKFLVYITSEKGDKDSLNAHIMDLNDFSLKTLLEKQMAIEKFNFSEQGNQLVFLASMDSSQIKNHTLYHWKNEWHNARPIVDSSTSHMPEGWTVSKHKTPYFSRSGDRIFLGTNKINEVEPEDSLLESEKVKLDIWHYQDNRIQPEQLSRLKKDKRKSYLAVFLLENRKFIQLANETVERIRVYDHGDSYYGLGIDTKPYEIERTWSSDWKADFYAVSIKGGKSRMIKKGITLGFGSGPALSPSGKYLMWFNPSDSSWMSFDLISNKDKNITSFTGYTFEDKANGVPGIAVRSRTYGWTLIEDEEYFLVSDKFNVWALHPSIVERSFCFTCENNKENQFKYSLMRTERDSTYLLLEASLIKGIDQDSYDEYLFEISNKEAKFRLTEVYSSAHKISYFQKAKNSDKVILRRESFQRYPDLESTTLSFNSIDKISDVNPQQEDYNWGTVEQVQWHAFDSLELKGILYKPEDFDSTKSYPMIVYFYSLNAHNIHKHYIPKPVYSYINFTEYVSNGYIIFVPDIKYGEPGHPGKDAYNCLVSGTQYLFRKHAWIDSTRLGIQGQSWGGYQAVQLITMTNMFKAAMAGAAVGNMFSAYGGIRWNSGLARTFQYEAGQSRIGATIWDHPELYIENSPVFHMDKVNTPLFLRHNDKDGAVPWYQSIEIYLGLRRQQKPVWLLNYNDEDHWNLKLQHRIDYNIRMMQFFDHYLKGAPMPIWMKEGRTALDKETKDALELEK